MLVFELELGWARSADLMGKRYTRSPDVVSHRPQQLRTVESFVRVDSRPEGEGGVDGHVGALITGGMPANIQGEVEVNPSNISGGARIWLDGRIASGKITETGGDVSLWEDSGSEGLDFDEGTEARPSFVTVGSYNGAQTVGAPEGLQSQAAITLVEPYVVSFSCRLDVWTANERHWAVSALGNQFLNRLLGVDQGFRLSLSANINTSGLDFVAPGWIAHTSLVSDVSTNEMWIDGVSQGTSIPNTVPPVASIVALMATVGGAANSELTLFDFAIWDNVDPLTFDFDTLHAWQATVRAGTGL